MKPYYAKILIAILFTSSCQTITLTPDSVSVKNTQMAFAWTAVAQTVYVDIPTTIVATPTATWWMTPKVTATPIAAQLGTSDDLYHLLKKLYPECPCIGYNYANSSSPQAVSKVEFIEVDIQPDSKLHWISEIADNIEKSLQAFVACEPELCQDKIYIKDEKTQKVYEVNWEWRVPWRPIQWVTWINNDTLAFFQSSNPEQGQIIVINVDKREYLYAAIVFPDYFCTTPTPTP
jgi:hypothetical protein